MITQTLPTGKSAAKILIVDDHPVVRDGLSLRIARQADMKVVGEAADSEEALRLIESTNPDLIIVDITLKRGSGIDLLKEISTRYPKIKTIVSSMHDEVLYAERALRAGAKGYVNKQEAASIIIEAIEAVLNGETFLSPAMQQHLQKRSSTGSNGTAKPPVESLSDRELEVMSMIGQGLATREIAERLDLSIHTIETYREKIKVKLNLKNAAELWRFAVEWVLQAK